MTNYVQTGDIDGTHPFRISNEDDVTDWLVDITNDRVVHMHAVSIEVDSNTGPALKVSNLGGLGGNQLEWTDASGGRTGVVDPSGNVRVQGYYTATTQGFGSSEWSGTTQNTTRLTQYDLVLAGPTGFGRDGIATISHKLSVLGHVADVEPLLAIDTSGAIWFGVGGTTTPDVKLYRDIADRLKTDDSFHVGADFRHLGSQLGFFGHGTNSKQTVTGSRSGNAALNSLLDALTNYGFLTDSTTA